FRDPLSRPGGDLCEAKIVVEAAIAPFVLKVQRRLKTPGRNVAPRDAGEMVGFRVRIGQKSSGIGRVGRELRIGIRICVMVRTETQASCLRLLSVRYEIRIVKRGSLRCSYDGEGLPAVCTVDRGPIDGALIRGNVQAEGGRRKPILKPLQQQPGGYP